MIVRAVHRPWGPDSAAEGRAVHHLTGHKRPVKNVPSVGPAGAGAWIGKYRVTGAEVDPAAAAGLVKTPGTDFRGDCRPARPRKLARQNGSVPNSAVLVVTTWEVNTRAGVWIRVCGIGQRLG